MKSPANPAAIVEVLGKPKLVSDPPLPLQRPRLWFGLFEVGDYEAETGGEDASTIVFQLSPGVKIERTVGRHASTMSTALGFLTVTDPEIRVRWRATGHARTLRIWLPHAELRAAAGDGRPCTVSSHFCSKDKGLQQCAHRALLALKDGDVANPLLLSSLAFQISVNLLTRPSEGSARASGGLSPTMARRVKEFLRAQISKDVGAAPTLSEIATETNLSIYHFSRQFRITFGMSPHAYSVQLRLERARDLLATSSMPVANVAIQTGFASPSDFSQRFHREMSVTPAALRRALRD